MVTKAELDRAFAPTTQRNRSVTLQPMPTAGGVTGGTRQTSSQTAATTQAASARTPRRQLSPQATNSGQSANERVNRALAIRQSMGGVQGSRATAETSANADLAENLRLNLIEQQRLRSNSRAPGRMNPVQFRAMQAEMAANQNAVNAGIDAVNAMRTGQVARAGQLTEAETTLQDRAMAEAGAFDRASLNLDVAETQGLFGLRKQTMANEGAVAARQAVNPLQAYALENLRTTRDQFAENGTPEEQAQMAIGQINAALGLSAMADPTTGPGLVEVEIPDANGMPQTLQVTPATAQRLGEYRAYRSNPGAWGLTEQDVVDNAEELISGTTTPQQIVAEKQARQQNRNQLVPSRVRTEPPQRQGM